MTSLVSTLLAVWTTVALGGLPASAGGDLQDAPAPAMAQAERPERPEGAAQADGDGDAARTPAATDCLDPAVDALQARYENVRDLRARFRQTTRPAHTGGTAPPPVTSSGQMVIAKPAKMRWEYEAPEKSLVVSDGESLWTYDPAFGEAQRLPVGEGMLSGAAVQFLLGEGDLRRSFRIGLVDCSGGTAELELTPREPASYEKLRVVVDRIDGTLSRTQVNDLLGNVTVVELSGLETNRDPDPATFVFEVPEGVSVIELDPSGVSRP